MGRTGFGAVYCSVLQCAAMCCRALQCAAMCCSTLQCATVLQREVHFGKDWVCHSVLQCVAVCCSVLQCYSVRCFLGRTSNSFREITRFTPRIFKSRYLQIYTHLICTNWVPSPKGQIGGAGPYIIIVLHND